MPPNPQSKFWSSFGPGLLWAAAAIGVSHLVQSTRAGAVAGFGLVGVILLALIIKYPFFEYGPRYAAATGSSLVEGYLRIGRWALWLYLAITLVMSVIIQSAVDAMAHAVEAYVSRIASPFTEMHSLKAIDLILRHLQEAVQTRTLNSLEQLSVAAISASMAFSSVRS